MLTGRVFRLGADVPDWCEPCIRDLGADVTNVDSTDYDFFVASFRTACTVAAPSALIVSPHWLLAAHAGKADGIAPPAPMSHALFRPLPSSSRIPRMNDVVCACDDMEPNDVKFAHLLCDAVGATFAAGDTSRASHLLCAAGTSKLDSAELAQHPRIVQAQRRNAAVSTAGEVASSANEPDAGPTQPIMLVELKWLTACVEEWNRVPAAPYAISTLLPADEPATGKAHAVEVAPLGLNKSSNKAEVKSTGKKNLKKRPKQIAAPSHDSSDEEADRKPSDSVAAATSTSVKQAAAGPHKASKRAKADKASSAPAVVDSSDEEPDPVARHTTAGVAIDGDSSDDEARTSPTSLPTVASASSTSANRAAARVAPQDDDKQEWKTDPLDHFWIGRKVRLFHHADYEEGVDALVVAFRPEDPKAKEYNALWRVRHDLDGDEEDLMLYQMPEALAAYERQMTCSVAKFPSARTDLNDAAVMGVDQWRTGSWVTYIAEEDETPKQMAKRIGIVPYLEDMRTLNKRLTDKKGKPINLTNGVKLKGSTIILLPAFHELKPLVIDEDNEDEVDHLDCDMCGSAMTHGRECNKCDWAICQLCYKFLTKPPPSSSVAPKDLERIQCHRDMERANYLGRERQGLPNPAAGPPPALSFVPPTKTSATESPVHPQHSQPPIPCPVCGGTCPSQAECEYILEQVKHNNSPST